MADTKVTALAEVSVPELEDLIYLVEDPSGTATSRKVTARRLLASVQPGVCGFRLTTETGVPVSLTDRTAQSTIYLTPDPRSESPGIVDLYDGTRWRRYLNAQISFALSGLTTDKNYDVFLYDNAGTLTIELSAAWTTNTARADALTTQNGVYVKSGALTRRYVGTIRTTGTTTTEDSEAKRFVWNLHNQVLRRLRITSGSSHTYASNTTRQWNNSTANQVAWVDGLGLEAIEASLGSNQTNSTTPLSAVLSMQIDAANTETFLLIQGPANNTFIGSLSHPFAAPGPGYHFIAATERCGAGTCTFTSLGISATVRG